MENENRSNAALRWIRCPECGKFLFQIEPRAQIRGMHIKCRGCRKTVKVNI